MGSRYCEECGTFVKTIEQKRQSIGNFDYGALYLIETCSVCGIRLMKTEIEPGKCCLPVYD